MADTWKFETQQIHAGASADPTTNSRATPIYRTTAYVFDSAQHAANLFALAEFGNIYTRINNPTQDVAEQRIAALEGGTAALLLASGQAATTNAILNIAYSGDHIVSSSSVYGGTYNLFKYTLPKLGITVTFVEDQDDLDAWAKAVRPNTKAFFGETIANPRINILDIAGVAGVAHEHNLPLIVDNTVASPYLLRPLEHGADIVVHSATKFLGGHGTVIAGAIVDGGKFPWSKHADKFPGLTEPDPSYHGASYTGVLGDPIAYIIKARVQLLRDIGAAVSPDNAFGLIQGIETLSLRMERHCQNALAVAQWLEAHDQVASVNYAALPSSPWHEAAAKYTPTEWARCCPSRSRAAWTPAEHWSTACHCLATWPTLVTCEASSFTPPRPPTPSSPPSSSSPRVSPPDWCDSPWASSTSRTSSPTWNLVSRQRKRSQPRACKTHSSPLRRAMAGVNPPAMLR
jgi:O-acetylhomoserine (thiol)-lyase